jgi:hypothetical protein
MTVLADFQTIIGDKSPLRVEIGNQQLGRDFEAGGRIDGNSETSPGAAFLMLTVTELFHATDVFVNGEGPVGTIQPSQTTGPRR